MKDKNCQMCTDCIDLSLRADGLEKALDVLLTNASEMVCDFSKDGRRGFYTLMGAISWLLEEYACLTNSVPLLSVDF
jgi:hypothetical protein